MKAYRTGTVRVAVPGVSTLPAEPLLTTPALQPTETLTSVLSNLSFLTREQIQLLTQIPYLSLSDRATLYQVIGLIQKIGFEQSYSYLTSVNNSKDFMWNLPTLEKARQKQEIDIEIMRNKAEVVAGAAKCSRCGSEEVLTAQRQTRSADEPMTNFHRCNACGNRWKS